MPKIPQIKPRDIEKILIREGFIGRTTKSSHVVYWHPDGRRTVVPVHSRPISTGTLKAILRQSNISVATLIRLLKK